MLEVRNASKTYRTTRGAVVALDDVSIAVDEGESLGVVGESGCGKSTLAKAITGLVRLDSGTVAIDHPEDRLPHESWRPQYVFQDPFASLSPRMRIGSALGEVVARHQRLRGSANDREVERILASVGLDRAVSAAFPHRLSGGMRQRVGIARALATRARFLVLDEPVSALDVSVRAEILNLLTDLRASLGLTFIVISHDIGVIHHLCERTVVMYLGRIVEAAPTTDVLADALHPYTAGLMASIPSVTDAFEPTRSASRFRVEGEITSRDTETVGCTFAPRCPIAATLCEQVRPPLSERGPLRQAACHASEDRHRLPLDDSWARAARAGVHPH